MTSLRSCVELVGEQVDRNLEMVEGLLDRPLAEVVLPELSVHSQADLLTWDIPLSEKSVLMQHGLPAVEGKLFQPDIQNEKRPSLRSPQGSLYKVGVLGPRLAVGVTKGQSRVLVVSSIAPADVRGVFNSSLGGFIDAMWRWARLLLVLDDALEDIDFIDGALDLFRDWQRIADPMPAGSEPSMWDALVEGW